MASLQGLSSLATNIENIFKAANEGINKSTSEIRNLKTAFEGFASVDVQSIADFSKKLNELNQAEQDYIRIAQKKARAKQMKAQAANLLAQAEIKLAQSRKGRNADIRVFVQKTKEKIEQTKMEIRAMQDTVVLTRGAIVHTQDLIREKAELTAKLKEQQNYMKAHADANRAFNATLEEQAMRYQVATGSIRELEAQNKALRASVKGLDIAENSEEMKAYNDIISANSFLIKANSDEATKQALTIGDYKTALQDGTEVTKSQSEALSELQQKYIEVQKEMSEMGLSAAAGEFTDEGELLFSEADFKKKETELRALAQEILKVKESSAQMNAEMNKPTSFRTRMRETREELMSLIEMERTGVKLTEEQKQKVQDLERELTKLSAIQGSTQRRISALSSSTFAMDKTINSIRLGTSVMQAYAGALELAGLNSKNYEQTMRKFAAMQTLVNGLSQINNLLMDGSTISIQLNNMAMSKNVALKWAGVAAQKALNLAVKASPYIAMAAILAYIIKLLGDYIDKIRFSTEEFKNFEYQVQTFSKSLTKASDSYLSSAVKIKNYQSAMESTTITIKGKEKILKSLNVILKEQGEKLNSVVEAEKWLKNKADDYIEGMQKRAIATALFSIQVDEVKEALKGMEVAFEDLKKEKWYEKLIPTSADFNNIIDLVKESFNKDGEIMLTVKGLNNSLEKLGTTGQKNVIEPFRIGLWKMQQSGELAKVKIEEINEAWIMQVAQQGQVYMTMKKSGDRLSGLLGTYAEFLEVGNNVTKGTGKLRKEFEFFTIEISYLYAIWRNELEEIGKTWQMAFENKITPSDFFDFSLFQQLSGQILENFDNIGIEYAKFTDETDDFFTNLVKISGEYSIFAANLEKGFDISHIEKQIELQKQAIHLYTERVGSEKGLIDEQTKIQKRLKELQEEYAEATTQEDIQRIQTEAKSLKDRATKIESSLKNIEKLRKEHLQSINELEELYTEYRINRLENEEERIEAYRNLAYTQEIQDFEEKEGLKTKILGSYANERYLIEREQRLKTLQLEKENLENAIRENREQQKRIAQEIIEQETIIKNAKGEFTQAEIIEAQNKLAQLQQVNNALIDSEYGLHTKRLEFREKEKQEEVDYLKFIQDKQKEAIDKLKDILKDTISEFNNLFDALDANKQAQLEKDLERINIWKDAQKKAIDDTAMSEEERIARTSELEVKFAKMEYDLEVEKWKLEVQGFRRKQVMDVASATQSYAKGMIEAFANYMTVPLLAPLGTAIMAGLSALFGVQLATILSTKPPLKPLPPAYAEGTDYHKGGVAIVGDAGKHEVVETKKGTFLTPAIPTLINLERGAKVYKDYSEYLNAKMGETSTAGDYIDSGGIISAIKENKSSVSLFFDKDGIYNVAHNGLNKNKYICKTLKL